MLDCRRKRLLDFLRAALFGRESGAIERFRFDEVHRFVNGGRGVGVVKLTRMVDPFGTLGRLQRRVRFQVQVQILNLVQLAAHNLIALQEVIDLGTEAQSNRQEKAAATASKNG